MALMAGQARTMESGAKASLKPSTIRPGKIRWAHDIGAGAGGGVLTTDTGLAFTGDFNGNVPGSRQQRWQNLSGTPAREA